MDKTKFIDELAKRTGISIDKCEEINKILENTFLLGSKDKIIEKIKTKLNLSDEIVNKVYDTAMDILGNGIMNKLKNPFKDLDK